MRPEVLRVDSDPDFSLCLRQPLRGGTVLTREDLPLGAKALDDVRVCGTTKVVPFQNARSFWSVERPAMTETEKLRAVLTDIHFLIPLIVFGIGLALLVTVH